MFFIRGDVFSAAFIGRRAVRASFAFTVSGRGWKSGGRQGSRLYFVIVCCLRILERKLVVVSETPEGTSVALVTVQPSVGRLGNNGPQLKSAIK